MKTYIQLIEDMTANEIRRKNAAEKLAARREAAKNRSRESIDNFNTKAKHQAEINKERVDNMHAKVAADRERMQHDAAERAAAREARREKLRQQERDRKASMEH